MNIAYEYYRKNVDFGHTLVRQDWWDVFGKHGGTKTNKSDVWQWFCLFFFSILGIDISSILSSLIHSLFEYPIPPNTATPTWNHSPAPRARSFRSSWVSNWFDTQTNWTGSVKPGCTMREPAASFRFPLPDGGGDDVPPAYQCHFFSCSCYESPSKSADDDDRPTRPTSSLESPGVGITMRFRRGRRPVVCGVVRSRFRGSFA